MIVIEVGIVIAMFVSVGSLVLEVFNGADVSCQPLSDVDASQKRSQGEKQVIEARPRDHPNEERIRDECSDESEQDEHTC